MEKIHLDTDLGGDLDDLCALAMLLRWPGGVELTGITTVAEIHGRRAGYIRYVLSLENRPTIPVAAGAEIDQGFYAYSIGLPDEARYWPEPQHPLTNSMDAALELLKSSIEQGAAIVAIGPYTNLALLEQRYPGILLNARLFLMGGYIYPTRPGFPQWGSNMDFNIQIDTRSAMHVLQHSQPTLIPLSVTVETALRRAYLPRLRAAGALGQLLAHQAEVFAVDQDNENRHGSTCPGLPDDIINFQHDPLACAVALGWQNGNMIEELPLVVEEKDGLLIERVAPEGKVMRVVTKVDGEKFNEMWVRVVARESHEQHCLLRFIR